MGAHCVRVSRARRPQRAAYYPAGSGAACRHAAEQWTMRPADSYQAPACRSLWLNKTRILGSLGGRKRATWARSVWPGRGRKLICFTHTPRRNRTSSGDVSHRLAGRPAPTRLHSAPVARRSPSILQLAVSTLVEARRQSAGRKRKRTGAPVRFDLICSGPSGYRRAHGGAESPFGLSPDQREAHTSLKVAHLAGYLKLARS